MSTGNLAGRIGGWIDRRANHTVFAVFHAESPNAHVKRTCGALAVRPHFYVIAARKTLVDVCFALRCAHRFILFRTTTRRYAANQMQGIDTVSWHGSFFSIMENYSMRVTNNLWR